MKTRMAFMGFRHGHILSVLKLAQQRPDTEVVATCEEHADTRNALIQGGLMCGEASKDAKIAGTLDIWWNQDAINKCMTDLKPKFKTYPELRTWRCLDKAEVTTLSTNP